MSWFPAWATWWVVLGKWEEGHFCWWGWGRNLGSCLHCRRGPLPCSLGAHPTTQPSV